VKSKDIFTCTKCRQHCVLRVAYLSNLQIIIEQKLKLKTTTCATNDCCANIQSMCK